MGSTVPIKSTMTSDMMHNHNCYAYLLQLKPFITQNILNLNQPFLDQVAKLSEFYNERIPYGNLYSSTIGALEDQLDSLYKRSNVEQTKDLDDLIYAIYHNNNEILEHGEWINKISLQTRPMQVDTSKRIISELEDNHPPINHIYPNQAESLISRLSALFSANFKPQLGTNLPSLKNFFYQDNSAQTEYRFGTQAQRHNGEVRISPLFKRWLLINAQRCDPEQSISHIYFNNLGLDRSDFDLAGSKEKYLSVALHELEKEPSLKIAVITLPASKLLMGETLYRKTDDKLTYDSVFKELIEIAKVKKYNSGIGDFFISTSIRKQVFENEAEQLKILMTNSFEQHGIKPCDTLSTAQKQAVWVHFIKFELTDHIIKTLKPRSYNFSCKDAIDRGALSSVYFNLMKSFKPPQKPMERVEFERALDAAAANVKGRGMNFHRMIIWNALNHYVQANYLELIKDPQKSWIIFWRDMNCPHSSVYSLLETRINQLQNQLDTLEPEQHELQEIGHKLLLEITKQYTAQISGQRLLLELVSRTSELLTTKKPSEQSLQSYKKLARELPITYPGLRVIAGLAEIFLGIILFVPSLGYSNHLINQGSSTYRTGFFVKQRTELINDILQLPDYISATINCL